MQENIQKTEPEVQSKTSNIDENDMFIRMVKQIIDHENRITYLENKMVDN